MKDDASDPKGLRKLTSSTYFSLSFFLFSSCYLFGNERNDDDETKDEEENEKRREEHNFVLLLLLLVPPLFIALFLFLFVFLVWWMKRRRTRFTFRVPESMQQQQLLHGSTNIGHLCPTSFARPLPNENEGREGRKLKDVFLFCTRDNASK
jgi:hypothetical protein